MLSGTIEYFSYSVDDTGICVDIYIYKMGTEKVVLWEVKGLIQVIVKFRTEICICFYHWTSFLGTWNFNNENICAQERFISFSYTIWFMISEKKYITMRRFLHRGACIHYKSLNEAYNFFFNFKLLLYGLVVLTDMNTYLQKEAGVLKHSWKKIIELLWTVVSYLL